MQTSRVLVLAGTAVVTAALILQVVGCATSAWIVFSAAEEWKLSVGLWKICGVPNKDECLRLEFVKDKDNNDHTAALRTCQVFSIIGILFLTATIALAMSQIVWTFLGHDVPRVITMTPLATAGVSLIAVLVSVIFWGVIIYKAIADHYKAEAILEVKLGYSFALSIVAGILGLMGAALFVTGVNKRVD